MYPRLFLAKNLLREDGVMLVSIDDNEVHNLRLLMNEVFGEENYYCTFAWQKKDTPSNDAQGVSVTHEYVVAYVRSAAFSRRLIPRTEEQLRNYKNPTNDPRGPWIRTALTRKEYVERDYYPIKNPQGRDVLPPAGTSWRVSRQTLQRLIKEDRIWWGKDNDGDMPFAKRFLSEVQEGVVPVTWWDYEFAGSNRNAKMELRDLFDDPPFDTPKPSKLLYQLLAISTSEDDIVLDFFAGSCTTAHATLKLNADDGGGRRFIMVQLPEPTGRRDFATIADIGKERVRRVINKLHEADNGKLPIEGGPQDRGFKVFRLTSSNFRIWNAGEAPEDEEGLAEQLRLYANHVAVGRSQEDILYELLLKAGFPLTVHIEKEEIAGQTIYRIAGEQLLVCLADPITPETLRGMVDEKPQRVICLDLAFRGNDQLKTNTVLEMRSHGVEFRTV